MTDTPNRQLSARLDREWAHLASRPGVVRRVRSWRLTDAAFDTLDELLGLAGHRACMAVGPVRPDTADALLSGLLALASTEPVAARVVLQRILPGLMAVVRDEQRRDSSHDALDELLGEAWIAIVRPRTAVPTSAVAARLIDEARHRAFVGPRRRRRVTEINDETADSAAPEHSSSFDELVSVLGEARRHGLADDHLKVVHGLLGHRTSRRLAATSGVTARTVYNHKREAIERIRRHALAAA